NHFLEPAGAFSPRIVILMPVNPRRGYLVDIAQPAYEMVQRFQLLRRRVCLREIAFERYIYEARYIDVPVRDSGYIALPRQPPPFCNIAVRIDEKMISNIFPAPAVYVKILHDSHRLPYGTGR